MSAGTVPTMIPVTADAARVNRRTSVFIGMSKPRTPVI
jgi:hypothetical protein